MPCFPDFLFRLFIAGTQRHCLFLYVDLKPCKIAAFISSNRFFSMWKFSCVHMR